MQKVPQSKYSIPQIVRQTRPVVDYDCSIGLQSIFVVEDMKAHGSVGSILLNPQLLIYLEICN